MTSRSQFLTSSCHFGSRLDASGFGKTILLVAALLALAASSASAAPEVYYQYFIGGVPAPQSGSQTATSGPLSFSRTHQDQDGSMSFSLSVDIGEASINGQSAAAAQGNIGAGYVIGPNTTTRWVDDLTFTSPGKEGTTGVVTVRYRVNGNLAVTGPSFNPDNQTRARASHRFISKTETFDQSSETSNYTVYVNSETAGENFLNKDITVSTRVVFGKPQSIGVEVGGAAQSYGFRGGSATANLTHEFAGIVSVKDEGGKDLPFTVSASSGKAYGPRSLWVAGRDMAQHEKPDGTADTAATNAKVPQWSYGSRASAAGTAFTPFTADQHLNAFGSEDVEGFSNPNSNLLVAVNTGSADVILSGDSQPAKPLRPQQMVLRPGSDGAFAVVRWTAPEKGTYNIGGRWLDLDASAGSGAIGHIVVNGVQVAGEPAQFNADSGPGFTGFAWQNGGGGNMPPQSFQLEAGAIVDFLLGGAGDTAGDLTAFTAVIRRAPDVVISGPDTAVEGQDVVVTVAENAGLAAVRLHVNGETLGTDKTAPFQFTLPNVRPGQYHIQAEGADASKVRAASNVIQLTVAQNTAAAAASSTSSGKGDVTSRASATAGTTYEAVGGFWSEPQAWRRKADGAIGVGVPGPDDLAIIGRSFQIVLSDNVTVKKLYLEGVLRGNTETTERELTVTEHFGMSGYMANLTLNIPETGLFTNVRSYASIENARLNNSGRMLLTQSLFATASELASSGSLTLLAPPGSGGPIAFLAENATLGGLASFGPGTRFEANRLVGPDGASLVGPDGASLVGPDGASLVGPDGASLVGPDGASLVGPDGASVIGTDGASLVGPDGASLVGPDGASIAFVAKGMIISRDGAGIRAPDRNTAAVMEESTLRPEATAETGGGILLEGGTVSGSLNLIGEVINSGAVIAPGRSAGVVRINGSYAQGSEASLLLEVGGTTANPPQYDQLQVFGPTSLGGKLIVKTIDGFTPSSGQSVTPLTYTSATGQFTSVTSNANVAFGPNGMTVEVNGPNPPAPKALNISTRMRVEAGDNALIAGFIITGSSPKKVLVRGIGPSLPVSGALADPVLSLDNGAVVNDDWKSTQEQEIRDTTIPPASDLESAIIATLNPGPHTAILRGKNNGTGVGLVEVYDLESGTPVQLANISTRGLVQAGDNVMIGGFIIGGDYPAKVLLRAIGPSLSVTGKLENPTLELVDANGGRISNDDWRATQEAEILATTVPPTNDKEAAIVATLVPGFYTAIVRGKDDTAGVALVEGYNLQ